MTDDAGTEPNADADTAVAFVCVENAGRSQMAAAFAERELAERDLDGGITVVSGGTDPAEHVHEVVVEAMGEVGIDVSDRQPRAITPAELAEVEYVVTMGCSADDVCPATWRGDARDWALDDPGGQDLATVREIRDEIRRRVSDLIDELVREQEEEASATHD
ncbi:MAG TPA: low molecular weight phosphatase family protein [Natrialbaceae archaeon]|nr:low molecular weight phosphatase family protein [Natrialbaceae archaeon]